MVNKGLINTDQKGFIMALNWQWSDKLGEVEGKDGVKLTLYRGNAFCIAIYHYEKKGEKYYDLAWFAASEDHMKNMLGLNKGYEECFSSFGIETLRLNIERKESIKLVQLIAKAKQEIKIELYKEV